MKLKYYIILFFTLSYVLFSCEKLLIKKNQASSDPFVNFDYLWKECDEKYAYFVVKNIDWNAVRTKYRAKLYAGMSEDSLFQVLGAMLRELKDDHVNLMSPFNISFFGVDHYGQDNYDNTIVQDVYLPKYYYITGPFVHDFINNTNKEIGYVRFSSFTGTVDDDNLDFVLDRYKDTKGLILDLRENGGGAVNDIFSIISRFVDQKTLLFYSHIKNGTGHNDFTTPEACFVSPSSHTRYQKKVCVLTDRGTYSAGSSFSLATKALPNMILVGDSTGGGLGLPNGGQLPNGWTYRFSITQGIDLNFDNSYEKGVPPDIYQLFNWNDLTKDAIIERALQELN